MYMIKNNNSIIFIYKIDDKQKKILFRFSFDDDDDDHILSYSLI